MRKLETNTLSNIWHNWAQPSMAPVTRKPAGGIETEMNILGLNAFHGDASGAVLRDGQLVAALEEERLNRIKHGAGLPVLAAEACLEGAQPDHIAIISRDPKAHLRDKLLRAALRPHQWLTLATRATNSVRIAQVGEMLAAERTVPRGARQVHFIEHHRAHLASAFFASPFEEAAVISIDGFGVPVYLSSKRDQNA
jgi:carbamoyltransferase